MVFGGKFRESKVTIIRKMKYNAEVNSLLRIRSKIEKKIGKLKSLEVKLMNRYDLKSDLWKESEEGEVVRMEKIRVRKSLKNANEALSDIENVIIKLEKQNNL